MSNRCKGRKCAHGRLKHPIGGRCCRKRARHGKAHCPHGRVTRGPRKGRCRKHARHRKSAIHTGYRRLAP